VLNGPPKVDTAPKKMVKAVKRFATGLLKAVEAMLDAPDFADSEELRERLEAIADEVAQVVAWRPNRSSCGERRDHRHLPRPQSLIAWRMLQRPRVNEHRPPRGAGASSGLSTPQRNHR
jgi:hypothetical protein